MKERWSMRIKKSPPSSKMKEKKPWQFPKERLLLIEESKIRELRVVPREQELSTGTSPPPLFSVKARNWIWRRGCKVEILFHTIWMRRGKNLHWQFNDAIAGPPIASQRNLQLLARLGDEVTCQLVKHLHKEHNHQHNHQQQQQHNCRHHDWSWSGEAGLSNGREPGTNHRVVEGRANGDKMD